MDQRSVFFEEWIRSLREQYKHVLRQDDRVTLPTLTAVMLDVGFSEDELAQLRIEATMHVDRIGSDHVADMEILKHTLPHAAECLCPICTLSDDQPSPIAPEQETVEPASVLSATAFENTETSETNDELALLTFEDSLAAGETEASDDEEPVDPGEDDEDVDKPQQMSLF